VRQDLFRVVLCAEKNINLLEGFQYLPARPLKGVAWKQRRHNGQKSWQGPGNFDLLGGTKTLKF